jgi:hypothetical protein
MRWAFLTVVLSLLTGCANAPITDYSPDTGSRSSLMGNQGGAGVQGAIWSNDPNKSTVSSRYFTPKD